MFGERVGAQASRHMLGPPRVVAPTQREIYA
ncbi:MAG: hypothetical protein GFH27_549333n61 [Chloroflexi bacterium AL-W]|nr:hypothetical protein [Chloroflexi bacterium AL-N1]NOK70486.1 hypothetical protein [Chloroflexi bacterium AL-N10]NOK78155.1 hypothetical protein [Chloroflexi bacterium AL-N5]NOK85254.1 hypothetical protein [Chloroflexi bacterium AL-W]NOK92019.1 hypothetical protein [Chloroflexi bacterium AL-N15]